MQTKPSRWLAVVGPFVAILAGCGEVQKSAPSPPGVNMQPAASESATDESDTANIEQTPAAGEVTVDVKDLDGIQNLIASKRGRVVVMDCWSTWCEPCVREFPGLVALHKKYGADDLACVSLSFNYEGGKNEKPEDYVEDVLGFLRSQDATFDNVIASVPSEDLYKQLGFESASVPAIFVYDREGNLARQFGGPEAKYADVGKLVAELIKKK